MASLLSIPPELLLKIELYLDKRSHIAYATCCRRLRTSGSLSLLSAHTVVLKTAADVESFCDFMHADLSSRKPYLRAIALLTPFPTSQDIHALQGRLAHALTNAPGITAFEFGRCLEEIFTGSPSLSDAVQSLPALTALRLGSNDNACIRTILGILHAPLSILHMQYSGVGVPDALARHASSLRSLSVGGRTIEAALGQLTFVHVRDLCWVGSLDAGAWDIASLVTKFPNLQRLTARKKGMEGLPGIEGLSQSIFNILNVIEGLEATVFPYEAVRLANIDAQRGRSWPQLQKMVGDPGAVFLLAPLCKLAVLSIIDNLISHNAVVHIYKIIDQLEHPVEILHLKYSPFWHSMLRDSIDPLPSLALPERTPHFVACLIVELHLYSDMTAQALQEIVAAWAPLIGKVAPRQVLLHVSVARCPQAGGYFPSPSEQYVSGEDVFSVGKSIGAHARSTQSILVKASWYGGHATRAWSVVEQPGSVLAVLEHLPSDVADDTEERVEELLARVA